MQNMDIFVAIAFACGISLLLALAIKWAIRIFFNKDVRLFTCWWAFMLSFTLLSEIWRLLFRPHS
jgi:hypothetical protein